MSRFGGGPSGLQGAAPLALSSNSKTLWKEEKKEKRKKSKAKWLHGLGSEIHADVGPRVKTVSFVMCIFVVKKKEEKKGGQRRKVASFPVLAASTGKEICRLNGAARLRHAEPTCISPPRPRPAAFKGIICDKRHSK